MIKTNIEKYDLGEIVKERATKLEDVVIDDYEGQPLFITLNMCKVSPEERELIKKGNLKVSLYLNSFTSCYFITIRIAGLYEGDGAIIAAQDHLEDEGKPYEPGTGRIVNLVIIDTWNGETLYLRTFTASTRFSNELRKAKKTLTENFTDVDTAFYAAKTYADKYTTKDFIKKTNIYTNASEE